METAAAIEVRDVTKQFGEVTALDRLDLEVERGTILGLLGPNGAGKTTTIDVLTTLQRPDRGTARVAGYDVVAQPDEVRSAIGLTGQFAALDGNLTALENLELFGRLLKLGRTRARERGRELLDRFALGDVADRRTSTFSGGMRRRLDLAASLVGTPSVLFLDEPTTGLDPRSRAVLWEVVRELRAEGMTILLTTQYLAEADELADRIAVIDRGTVTAEGTPAELKRQVGGAACHLTVESAPVRERIAALLRPIGPVGVVHDGLTLPAEDGAGTLAEVVRRLDAEGIAVEDIALRRPTLDDVFFRLTGHDTAGTGDGDGPATGGTGETAGAAGREGDAR